MNALLFPRTSSAPEVAAEGEVKVHAFAEAGGADFSEFDFCSEVFAGEPEDGKHVLLAFAEAGAAKLNGFSAGRDHVTERVFAFAQIVVAGECVFDILERVQRHA